MPGKLGMDRVENFRLWPGNPLPSPPPEGEGICFLWGRRKQDERCPRINLISLFPSCSLFLSPPPLGEG